MPERKARIHDTTLRTESSMRRLHDGIKIYIYICALLPGNDVRVSGKLTMLCVPQIDQVQRELPRQKDFPEDQSRQQKISLQSL